MISFAAGSVVTSGQLNLLAPIYAVKAADQSVTNSATLVNDTDLVFTLVANQTIHLQALLSVSATSAVPGLRLAWSTTGTVNVVARHVLGPADTIADVSSEHDMKVQMRVLTGATNNFNALTVAGSFPFSVREDLIATTGASGGTLQLQFSEFTATAATSVTLKAGTFAVSRYVA